MLTRQVNCGSGLFKLNGFKITRRNVTSIPPPKRRKYSDFPILMNENQFYRFSTSLHYELINDFLIIVSLTS
ncbi:hypothetical protein RhiirB3_262710 [Rhizophagus irregularis]|nr:hypothetical protein RhiirB3_262710 [Rhizophagus irregularis]